MLEYAVLGADDSNFVDEYTITYARRHSRDTTGDELEVFLSEVSADLQANGGLNACKKEFLRGRLTVLDFKSHLYAPLLCLEKSDLNIQASPAILNRDEMIFVDYLREYVENHDGELKGKSLYLLRNRSKTGMGFFEGGNFYPDFILWIDTDEKQYISFIDPKGLLHVPPDDPKVELSKTIKEVEARLAPTVVEKTVILNSFILSGTPSSQLHQYWGMERPQREEKNVYTLDNPECVESMIGKILRSKTSSPQGRSGVLKEYPGSDAKRRGRMPSPPFFIFPPPSLCSLWSLLSRGGCHFFHINSCFFTWRGRGSSLRCHPLQTPHFRRRGSSRQRRAERTTRHPAFESGGLPQFALRSTPLRGRRHGGCYMRPTPVQNHNIHHAPP